MSNQDQRSVAITESGRSGEVIYREPGGELAFHWEIGGGDVVAIVQTGTREVWNAQYRWAAGRRSEILRFVAVETVWQKAPRARAEIDERSGDIVLRQAAPSAVTPGPPDVAWYYRLRNLRVRLALGVLAAAAIFAGFMWLKNAFLSIDPGKGTPIGLSVRTEAHIATLIQTLEPYTPSLNRDHGRDRYAISLFVVPLDGSEPRLIPIAGGLAPNQFALAKILGSDGRALWFDVSGAGAVDLSNYSLDRVEGPVPKGLQGGHSTPFPPRPDAFLSAGFLAAPDAWFGVHSSTELERDYTPQKFVRRVVPAAETKEMRRFQRAALELDSSGKYYRILSIEQIGGAEFLNAAFLRIDDQSEPLRLTGPDGALMLYTSAPGLQGTAMIARVDTAGAIVWNADTGIDRFNLAQILPGTDSMAFVGTRPREEGKVPEPLLVIVENATGLVTTHSLWR